MLLAAKGAVPFYEGVHTYYGLAIGAFLFGAWYKVIWPWLKPKVRAWKDRRLLMLGRPGVDGVADEVLPLGRRLKRQEKRIDEVASEVRVVKETTTRLDEGQVEILRRQEQHVDRVEKIDARVGTLIERQDKALEMLGHLFENGKNSNNPGDINARLAQANGVYLEHPELPTYDPSKDVMHDRRKGDKT